jgi:hypothetical protein
MRTLNPPSGSFPTADEYRAAFGTCRDEMTLNHLLLLQRHYHSPGRTATARELADKIGYSDWRGVNLQYGLLAKRLCEVLGVEIDGESVYILATFRREAGVKDGELQFVMRPQLAEALEALGWVW